jgi:hypothetical protein
MKFTRAQRIAARAKFKKELQRQSASMQSFNDSKNDLYPVSEVNIMRARANKEFSHLTKESRKLQLKAFRSLSGFWVK